MAMRTTIADIIRSITPLDVLERDQIATTLAWIASGAPLCRIEAPATPPQHLVSYCVVIDSEREAMLLVDHKKAELWLPSGGHVEPGEHPRDTVVRELREELALEAVFLSPDPLLLTVSETVGNTARHHDVSLWYALRGNSLEPLQYDPAEFERVAWFPLDSLPYPRTDPQLARFVAKLRALSDAR